MKLMLVDFYYKGEIIKWKKLQKRREAEPLQNISSTIAWQQIIFR